MKKAILNSSIALFISCICYGQQLSTTGSFRLPPVENDTLYLDVENVIKLKEASPFISVSGENQILKIKNDELIIVPTRIGLLTINFVYSDKKEKRNFFCKLLPPQPGK